MIHIDAVHQGRPRRDLPPFRPGDTVRVHVNITEGDKRRIQVFEGVVLRRRGGGRSETFTVRKLSYGVGVERVFFVESPAVAKVEIKSRGHVRRSRLYYLRGRTGKKARLRSKVRDLSRLVSAAEAEGDVDAAEAAARAGEEAEAAAREAAEAEVSAGTADAVARAAEEAEAAARAAEEAEAAARAAEEEAEAAETAPEVEPPAADEAPEEKA